MSIERRFNLLALLTTNSSVTGEGLPLLKLSPLYDSVSSYEVVKWPAALSRDAFESVNAVR